jgi:hypothetical protein
MYLRILIFLISLAVLLLLLRSLLRGVSERVRHAIPRRRPRYRGVEEPPSRVESTRDKMVLTVMLPEISSEGDVEIKKLSKSIEVRAYAGDKVYFKLFPIPPGSRILSRRMEEGRYIIEVSRGGGRCGG